MLQPTKGVIIMDDKLYIKLKTSLISYDFTKAHTSFNDLFKHSRQFHHGVPFRRFVRVVKDLGVSSACWRREDGVVRRGLVYKCENDKYLHTSNLVTTCPTCEGTGFVKTSPPEVG
jgi:hypothetical protein